MLKRRMFVFQDQSNEVKGKKKSPSALAPGGAEDIDMMKIDLESKPVECPFMYLHSELRG